MKLIALAFLVTAIAVPSALARTSTNTLTGTVGPGFVITVTQGGKHVSKLKAGVYTIVVHDKSTIHNFHLFGPGVSKRTSVATSGTSTWKVTLKKGTYHYQCDPHQAAMFGAFVVS